MSLTDAESQALIAVFALIVAIAPTLTIAIQAYLKAKTNEIQLRDTPSHQQVQTLIDDKAKEILEQTNGTDTPPTL